MRRTAALLTVLLAAGCSATPPPGTDGDLTDDWAALSTPAPFRPVAGQCHEALATTAPVDGYRPVDCAELHVSETFHVGTPADADVAPAAGTSGAKAAYRECSDAATDFLGAGWRGARVAVQVVWPTRAGWTGGARWFRCDVTTADLDGQSHTSRTGSLAGELSHPSPLRLACFDPKIDGGTVTAMTAVPCTTAHRAEFAGLWTAPDVSYSNLESDTGAAPRPAAARSPASRRCRTTPTCSTEAAGSPTTRPAPSGCPASAGSAASSTSPGAASAAH